MDNKKILKQYGFERVVRTDYRDYEHQLWESREFLLKAYGPHRPRELSRYLLEPKNLPAEEAGRGWVSQSLPVLLKNNCGA